MSDEVRWCTSCESASAIEVKLVQRTDEVSLYGLSARQHSVRRQFRCQACGTGFELRPRSDATTSIIIDAVVIAAATTLEIGVLVQMSSAAEVGTGLAIFLPFQLVFGLLLALAVRRRRLWDRHRVVDGAPRPPLRFTAPARPEDTPRRCACGASATLEKTVVHGVQGLPMGREWRYRCEACKREFQLVSAWRSVRPELVVGGVLAATVLPMFVDPQPWSSIILAAVVLGVCAGAFRARRAAHEHPPVIPSATVRARG